MQTNKLVYYGGLALVGAGLLFAASMIMDGGKTEGFESGSIAKANIGEFKGVVPLSLPQSYANAIVSSRRNDLPFTESRDINIVNSGALTGVGYPVFNENHPRLDDRQF